MTCSTCPPHLQRESSFCLRGTWLRATHLQGAPQKPRAEFNPPVLFLFLLKYSRLTMLCQLLLHSKVTLSYIHIHIFLILSSILVYPKRLDRVPCAVQHSLMADPFSVSGFASTNPTLSVHPTPSPLATTSVFSVSVSLFLFCRQALPYFRFHTEVRS